MYTAIINDKTFEIEQKKGEWVVNGKQVILNSEQLKPQVWHVLLNNHSYTVELLNTEGKNCTLNVNGKKLEVQLKDTMDKLMAQLGFDTATAGKVNDIKAPMPGLVLNVLIEQGQTVKKGDALLVLEAMKMENVIKSPGDGVVSKILIKPKDKVEKNQVLINL